MMAVLHGRISISAPSPDGRQVVFSVLRGGDIFGEIALLDGKERTADVDALTDCEILIVSRRSFWPLLKRRPDVCIDLTLVLCERLRHTNQKVVDLAFLDLEARIAKVLLRLAEESGAGEVQAKPVALRISQHELGELVGGSRERVNKHLHAWKRSGIVTLKRGLIVILDMAALAECASPAARLIGTPRKRTISAREVGHEGSNEPDRSTAGRHGAATRVWARWPDVAIAQEYGGVAAAARRGSGNDITETSARSPRL